MSLQRNKDRAGGQKLSLAPCLMPGRFVSMKRATFALAFLVLALSGMAANAEERFITLASTTSTEQSGLFGHVLPIFQKATGVAVHVVAAGTGQALAIGMRGGADLLVGH